MSKVKKHRITKEEMRNIAIFKDCVAKTFSKSADVQSVEFEEIYEEKQLALAAHIGYRSFELKLYYYPLFWLSENLVDFRFHFNNCPCDATVYDVFNAYDINDFELYYYECEGEAEMLKALQCIQGVTQKYIDYIERIADNADELLKEIELDNGFEEDDDEDEEFKNEVLDALNSPFEMNSAHPFFSCANGNVNERTHKKLVKKQKKDELLSNYEKRLLVYLEAGNTVERKTVAEEKQNRKSIMKYIWLTGCVFALIAFGILQLAAFVYNKVQFDGALYVLYEERFKLLFCAGASISISALLVSLFGKQIVSRLVPDASGERIDDLLSGAKVRKGNRALEKVFSAIFLIFIPIVCIMIVTNGCAFYEDRVVIPNGAFQTQTIYYDKLVVYKVNGYYDDVGEYVSHEDDPVYVLTDGTYFYNADYSKSESIVNIISELRSDYGVNVVTVGEQGSIPNYYLAGCFL